MQNSQLLKTLRCLTDKQWETLGKYLRSPYFFDGAEKEFSPELALFTYLEAHFPHLDGKKLEKKYIIQQVFSKSKIC